MSTGKKNKFFAILLFWETIQRNVKVDLGRDGKDCEIKEEVFNVAKLSLYEAPKQR
jgi:hypothetical protein